VNDVELCGPEGLASFHWPEGTDYERAFLTPLVRDGARPYIANIDTRMMLLRVGNIVMPVTVNEREYDNSYVCSPYTAVISYPLEELAKLKSRTLRGALRALIHVMAPLMRGGGINQVVCVNNWLLSTNLYPAWNGAGLDRLTEMLIAQFPDKAIMFRSLNRATNDELCQAFVKAGYVLAPSRQVYMFDGVKPDYLRKQDTRRDQKLLRDTSYTLVSHDALTDDDDEDVVRLYNMLYLKKYSYYNPQFTVKLVRLWRLERLMKLFGLRGPHGRLDGVVGCFSRNQVLTTPLVGYDTTVPIEEGLYRMLAAIVLREAAQRSMTLNMSSGVAGFKRLRGGAPQIEYSAIFYAHLPWRRRGIWRTLSLLLTQVGARVLKKYQL
jgi:hypothetical protein